MQATNTCEKLNDLSERLRALMQGEVNQARETIEQIRSLVASACSNLSQSFRGLDDAASSQIKLLKSTFSQSQENAAVSQRSVTFQEFATATDDVLQGFVKNILKTSQSSMEMVSMVDDMATHMKSMLALLNDLMRITDQTNLLALNATIEAARAGDRGKGFGVVATEVRALSKDSKRFSDTLTEIVRKTAKNMLETRSMMNSMASADMTLAFDAKARVDEMLTQVASMNADLEVKIGEISQIAQLINGAVGQAIRGLQFEDIVRQLLEFVSQRLSMLEQVAFDVCDLKFRDSSSDDVVGVLESKFDHCIEKMLVLAQSAKPKPADQTTMDSGSVDLF